MQLLAHYQCIAPACPSAPLSMTQPRLVMVHRWFVTGPAHAKAAALGRAPPLHRQGTERA